MTKLIAFDLDGTIIDDNHKIVEANKLAIQNLNKLGIITVPCTGRGMTFLDNVINELQLDKKGDYLIACNGALVVDMYTNEIVLCDAIKHEDVIKLFNYGINKGFDVQLYTPYNTYAFNKEQKVSERALFYGDGLEFIESNDMSFLENQSVVKIVYERAQSVKNIKEVENEIREIMNESIEVIISNRSIIELAAHNVTKASGLTYLANYLGINMKDTIAVGDSGNDKEMIKAAGLGVAVSNATEEIKSVAMIVAESSNNDGILNEVFDKYIRGSKQND